MDNATECCLIPFDNSLSLVRVPDGIETLLGRSRESNIKEKLCSRKQVSLVAAYEKSELLVKCVGINPSAIDGKTVKRNTLYTVKNNSVVELVTGLLKYTVQFNYNTNGISVLKRSSQLESDEVSPKQIRMNSYGKWKEYFSKTLLEFSTPDFIWRSKVASFDLDSTLIKTKSGHVFPKDQSDWKIWDPQVKTALSKLHNEGFMLAIFTNQAGLAPPFSQEKMSAFRLKIEAIVREFGFPMIVYVSTSYGLYRKPAPGMWNFLVNSSSFPVTKEESFYVGDAAGRENNWKPGKKKDFSMSDRLFALNLDLKFYTPEEYFLKEPKASYSEVTFIPGIFGLTSEPNYKIYSEKQDVILMVGSPASGKSTFVTNKLIPRGYTNVSRDNLGSWQKCIKDLEKDLTLGKNVVIDNTNPDIASRSRYIEICRQLDIPIRCFVMDCSLDRALHNNIFRIIKGSSHPVVNSNIIKSFYSNFEEPMLEEGFSEILYVPFIPHFRSNGDEELYKCYLICNKNKY